jgi:hypothetical protein
MLSVFRDLPNPARFNLASQAWIFRPLVVESRTAPDLARTGLPYLSRSEAKAPNYASID